MGHCSFKRRQILNYPDPWVSLFLHWCPEKNPPKTGFEIQTELHRPKRGTLFASYSPAPVLWLLFSDPRLPCSAPPQNLALFSLMHPFMSPLLSVFSGTGKFEKQYPHQKAQIQHASPVNDFKKFLFSREQLIVAEREMATMWGKTLIVYLT